MGRNRKVGLDWWPRDIGLYRDPKLRAARQKFGVLGPYVYECLLDIAYGDKGYYIAYSGEGREDTLWQLREYTAGLENVTIETLAAVVDQLAASGLFHAALYERGFLTSKRIQMGYFLATVTRNAVPINFDIWLLTEQEMREKNPSGKSFVLRAFISRTENAIYRTENAIYCTENPQSREEQRTEEQRTVEDSRAEQTREEKAVTADSGLTTELEEKLNCKFDHNFCLELRRLQNKGMQREVFLDTARQTLRMHRAIRQGISARCCRTASVTAFSPRRICRNGQNPHRRSLQSGRRANSCPRSIRNGTSGSSGTQGKRRCRHNPFQPRPCLL